MSGEGSQALPQGSHAFRTINSGATVDNSLVGAGGVELQPGFDDVDGLQTRRFHDPSDGAGEGFHVRWNRGYLGFRHYFLNRR